MAISFGGPKRLEDWSAGPVSPYSAPEQGMVLRGRIYNHSHIPDGLFVRTTIIKEVNGNKITTQSGSVYELGEPAPEYIQWCKDNNHYVPTAEEPIKLCS